MTKEELIKIGLIPDKSYFGVYFVPIAGDKQINENTTIRDIYQMIYETGVRDGIGKGRKSKEQEIKAVLGITE